MAFSGNVSVTRDWTQLTSGDVTAITIGHRGSQEVEILGTVGATPPANISGASGILLERGVAVLNRTMLDLFPGVSGANRVYARIAGGHIGDTVAAATVHVGHA